MEYPKLTPIELEVNEYDFKVAIANVRRLPNGSPIADILMRCYNKQQRHMNALEIELEVMEGINNGKGDMGSPAESIGHTVSGSEVRVQASDMRTHQP